MPYQVSKLLKDIDSTKKLTSDGSAFMNEFLSVLYRKIKAISRNDMDKIQKHFGESLGGYVANATNNYNIVKNMQPKLMSSIKDTVKLTFPLKKEKLETIEEAVYRTTILEEVCKDVLVMSVSKAVDSKIGKAQILLVLAFDKLKTSVETYNQMSPLAKLSYRLGFVVHVPTAKQLDEKNHKLSVYGMRDVLIKKGYQAIRTKDLTGGLSYSECLTVLSYKKKGCKRAHQVKNEKGVCVGRKPAPRRSPKRSRRRSPRRN